MNTSNIKLKLISGESCVSKPALLSRNGEDLYVSWQNTINGYAVKTGKKIKEFRGIKSKLINFDYIVKYDKEFIVAASNRTNFKSRINIISVFIWDALTTALLERFELKTAGVLIDFTLVDLRLKNGEYTFKAILVVSEDSMKKALMYDSEKQNLMQVFIASYDEDFKYAIGGDSEKYFVFVLRNRWFLGKFGQRKIRKEGLNQHDITAVACHPTEECVLIGDTSGRIFLMQGFSENAPKKAKFHWHSLPVEAISFSPSGTSFFSGGRENVLVKWNIENIDDRKFLPRLPEAIKFISVSDCNTHIAVSTDDNSVRILDPQFKELQVIQQFFRGTSQEAGLVYDERSKCLVFNSISGHIQFFKPDASTLVHSLDIVGQNKVTGEVDFEIQSTEVTGLAFSKSCNWLATIEQRFNTDLDKELKLKFWFYDKTDQKYHLNTVIDFPHNNSVTKVLFQPTIKESNLKCVTISNDQKFKIWEVVHVKTVDRGGYSWKCISAAYYKDLTPLDACFSSDSSLLAVAFGPILTTWLPDTCEMKCSLVHTSQRRRNINYVVSGKGNQCHLIVTATQKEICVWNLLSLSMVWMVYVDVSLLISDPYSPYMAVFTNSNKMIIFTPDSSKPIYQNSKLLFDNAKVHSAVFTKNSTDIDNEWLQKSHLYILDSQFNIYSVERKKRIELQDVTRVDTNNSLLKLMQPNRKSTNMNEIAPILHNNNTHDDDKMRARRMRDFLDAPVHTMPPMRLICKSILESLIEMNYEKIKTNES